MKINSQVGPLNLKQTNQQTNKQCFKSDYDVQNQDS